MEISDTKIEQLKQMKEYYKRQDLHINDTDSISDIRLKDMDYGKLIAYEHVCTLLDIE